MTHDDVEVIRKHLAEAGEQLRLVRQSFEQLTAFVVSVMPEAGHRLTPTQRDILAVLTEEPQQSRRLARLSGHSYSGRFRINLARLVGLGFARRTTRGYCKP